MNKKKCTKCLEHKNVSEFHRHQTHKDYLQSRCKVCKTKSFKEDHLRKTYNITVDQFKQMLTEQKMVCAICHQPETKIDGRVGTIKDLSVDHNHETDVVRGLLCNSCNISLGYYEKIIKTGLLDKFNTYLFK